MVLHRLEKEKKQKQNKKTKRNYIVHMYMIIRTKNHCPAYYLCTDLAPPATPRL